MRLLNICIIAEVNNSVRKYKFEVIIEADFCKLYKIIMKLEVFIKETYINIKDFLFFIIIVMFN